jgi:hypothetical protein
MKKINPHFERFVLLYVLGLVCILILAAAYILMPTGKFEVPTWVQAVGSIAAILVAVWVSSDQTKQQRQRDDKREADEIEGVVRCIEAEVQTSLKYMSKEVLPALKRVSHGSPIRSKFRLPEYPFPIFDALIPKLGMLPAGLRRDMIHAYAEAKSLAMTTSVHNDLAEAFDSVEIRFNARPPLAANDEFNGALQALTNYGDTLRLAFDETHKDLHALHKKLSDAYPELP